MIKGAVILVIVGLIAASRGQTIRVSGAGRDIQVDSSTGSAQVITPYKSVRVEGTPDERVVSVDGQTVTINRWGGCGWLGRPCFKVEYIGAGGVTQVWNVDSYPSSIILGPKVILKY